MKAKDGSTMRRLIVALALSLGGCHSPSVPPPPEDGGVDPNNPPCSGVPAPTEPFKATSDNCQQPEGTWGSGNISLRDNVGSWVAAATIYGAWTGDSARSVSCGQCRVRSRPYACGSFDRGDDIHAGDALTISSARKTADIPYLYQHPNYYGSISGEGERFSMDGETLRFSAPGGTRVGAFSRELVAPSRVLVTEPRPEASGSIALRRGTPVTVRWQNGGAGVVHVVLSQEASYDLTRTVECDFPAAAGVGVIPGDLLSTFEPRTGVIKMKSINQERFTHDALSLNISAEIPSGSAENGSPFEYPVDLQ